MAKRTLNNMNVVFGIVDKRINKMESDEGSFYLQNLIFNLSIRMGLTRIDKDVFMESMSSMYDMGQQLKEKWNNNND